MQFAEMLQEHGLSSGPVYATGLLKGHEAARMIADTKAQETIGAAHDRIIIETAAEPEGMLIERLSRFYHSDYVKHNQPWVRKIPFADWLQRQLRRRAEVVVNVDDY